MKRVLKLVIALNVIIAFVIAVPLYAQTPKKKPEITRKQVDFYVEALAESHRIKKDSPLYPRLKQKIMEQHTLEFKEKAPMDPRIIKHFRSEHGIEFPDKESFAYKPGRKKPRVVDPEKRRRAREKRKQAQMRLFRAKALPACQENSSKKLKALLPPELAKLKNTVIFDMLFLKENAPKESDSLSADFKEFFGERTIVHYYRPETGDISSLTASRNGVDCLPFRVRVYNKNKYFDRGDNALKKYNKKGSGKGKMHPYVKRKLEDFRE